MPRACGSTGRKSSGVQAVVGALTCLPVLEDVKARRVLLMPCDDVLGVTTIATLGRTCRPMDAKARATPMHP